MSHGFIVTLNNQTIHEYNETRIPGRLKRYLDEMDQGMEMGVQLGDHWQDHPTDFQKQQYVAMVLFRGLQKKDSNLVNIVSAYLQDRYKSLSEINIDQSEDLIDLQIVSL